MHYQKTSIILLLMLFTFFSGIAFSQQPAWKEMEDFHAVMGVTFHPADEDNLQPVKEKAGDLLRKALDWQQAAMPQGYNSEASKPILKKPVKQCKALKAAVEKKKLDAELEKMITEAHEVFHEIKEKCVEK